MKSQSITTRLLYLILISIINHLEVKGQSYIPMLSDSLYWDIAYADMNAFCNEYGNPGAGPYRYAIDTDTLINNIVYKKFKSYPFFSTLQQPSPNCPPFAIDTVLATNLITSYLFLREDTLAQKVYRYDVNFSQEDLLYDFDVQIGDSLYYSFFGDFVVDTIFPIVTLDGKTRKFIQCSTSTHPLCGYYVEGLGGNAGVMHDPYSVFENGPWLLCISDLNQNTIYDPNQNPQCSYFTTSLNQLSLEQSTILIYPNPAQDFLLLKGIKKNQTITLINVLGKQIATYIPDDKSRISTAQLTTGLYFVIASQNEIKYAIGCFVKN
jgi:hypothetical protein